MGVLLLLTLMLPADPAASEGFVVRDLTGLEQAARSALSGDYLARAEPARLTLTCPGCPGAPMLDIRIGRQTDGTEERVRSGATTIAQLQAQCQARDPACQVEAVRVPPAVAWISTYALGTTAGNTVVVLRDGDLLSIRSLAADPVLARRNADAMIVAILPRIVGQ